MNLRKRTDKEGMCIEYTNDKGSLHREDGPAQIDHYLDGSIYCESFYINGYRHREVGPAEIRYYYDFRSIQRESFYSHNSLHREVGPAVIRYYADGSIDAEEFCLYGVRLGFGKEGFWCLWDRLSNKQRLTPEFLKCMMRFL